MTSFMNPHEVHVQSKPWSKPNKTVLEQCVYFKNNKITGNSSDNTKLFTNQLFIHESHLNKEKNSFTWIWKHRNIFNHDSRIKKHQITIHEKKNRLITLHVKSVWLSRKPTTYDNPIFDSFIFTVIAMQIENLLEHSFIIIAYSTKVICTGYTCLQRNINLFHYWQWNKLWFQIWSKILIQLPFSESLLKRILNL